MPTAKRRKKEKKQRKKWKARVVEWFNKVEELKKIFEGSALGARTLTPTLPVVNGIPVAKEYSDITYMNNEEYFIYFRISRAATERLFNCLNIRHGNVWFHALLFYLSELNTNYAEFFRTFNIGDKENFQICCLSISSKMQEFPSLFMATFPSREDIRRMGTKIYQRFKVKYVCGILTSHKFQGKNGKSLYAYSLVDDYKRHRCICICSSEMKPKQFEQSEFWVKLVPMLGENLKIVADPSYSVLNCTRLITKVDHDSNALDEMLKFGKGAFELTIRRFSKLKDTYLDFVDPDIIRAACYLHNYAMSFDNKILPWQQT